MNLIDSVWGMMASSNSSNEEESWTEAYLVDRLKEQLAMVREQVPANRKVHDDRKYYNLCYNFLLIGAFRPTIPFPVNISDLSDKLLIELDCLDKDDRKYVLKQAVGRIFEDINPRLYHESISRVLEVLLVD